MKVLITWSKMVKAKKDGKEWLLIHGMKDTGEVLKLTMAPDRVPEGLEEKSMVPAEIENLMSEFQTVNIEYNETGRVHAISL